MLHPSLQVALASLDVPLDAELDRYRQHRKRMSPPPPPPPSQPVVVEGRLESSEMTSEETSPWDVSSDLAADGDGTRIELPAESATTTESDALGDASESTVAPQTYLESAQRLRQEAESPGESEAGLSIGVTGMAAESSESSESQDEGERKFTALGVGSVLLFLAATATLGYVLVNPESLSQLGLERFFTEETATEEEDETTSTAESRPTRLPTSPDLAAEEFIQLDLSTLSSLDPETRSPLVTPPPTPEAPSQPAVPAATPSEGADESENTLDNISALLTPETAEDSQTAGSPESGTETPQPPEPAATEESSGPPPTIDRDDNYAGFIFVVVDYNNQVSTLNQVREVVPDAYLRQFPGGVKVQVGAFDDTQSAESLVNRLQEDGISAQVYQAP